MAMSVKPSAEKTNGTVRATEAIKSIAIIDTARARRHVCGDGGRDVPVSAGPWDTEACSEAAIGEGEPSAFAPDAQ
jgi:hypothetical protein